MKASTTRAFSLHTLGGLSLEGTSFTRPKPLLLLTYLSLEGSQSRRHIAELFWPEASDHMNSLTVALAQIRQAGSNLIETDDAQIRPLVESDAKEFLTLLEQRDFIKALELYQGSFLEGFFLKDWGEELEEWVYRTREILAGRAREAMLKVAENEAAKGLFEQAANRAETAYRLRGSDLLESEDTNRLYRLLVAGRNPYAAEVAKEANDLGITLALSTSEAQMQLLAPSPKQTAHKLPAYATPFVGRKHELENVTRLLLDDPSCRLLTLMGPGGIGKTRFALEAASSTLGAFSHGVFFIPLASVSVPSGILPAIAEGVGLQLYSNTPLKEQLLEYLAARQMLLVLDNFEHLTEAAVELSELLRACPNLRIIATSRERLDLEEEQLFPLSGLSYPLENMVLLEEAETFNAVKLFVDRAKRVRPDFALNQADLGAVLEICRHVDGMPLGLELAAAWVRAMSVKEIANELQRNLDLLSTSVKNISERHRSIRAVLEYSWNLLRSEEQDVMSKLSVFRGGFLRGGFRREAASKVVGATPALLAALVDKSFLRLDDNGRYHRHPLVLEFTKEKLSLQPELEAQIRNAHSTYFLVQLAHWADDVPASKQHAILNVLGEEKENVQTAWRWAAEHGQSHALDKAIPSLFDFYAIRSHFQEGLDLFDDALRALPPLPEHKDVIAKLRLRNANFRLALGDYKMAMTLAQHSLTMTEDERERAFALETLGKCHNFLGQHETAEHYYRDSIASFRRLAEPVGLALALIGFAHLFNSSARFQEASDAAREALEISRNTSHLNLVTYALSSLAWASCCLGRYEESENGWKESLDLCRALGLRHGVGSALNCLGWLAWSRADKDLGKAVQLIEDAQSIHRAIYNGRSSAMCLSDLTIILAEQGDFQQAMEKGWEALELAKETGQPYLLPYIFYGLGDASLGLGDVAKSRQYLQESVSLTLSRCLPDHTANALYYFAKLLRAETKKLEATQVLACILEQPTTWQAIKDRAKVSLSELESEITAKDFAKAKAEGQKQRLEEIARDIV
jgi:predicted ATPase